MTAPEPVTRPNPRVVPAARISPVTLAPLPPQCPSCDGPVADAERYCESCGCDLRACGGDAERGLVWRSTTAGVLPCGGCGEMAVTADGRCERCGRSRTGADDRIAVELPGAAGVTDRGRLRGRNEDAIAVGRLGRDGVVYTAAVVCDGVSTSTQGDAAARAAVDAAIVVLLDVLVRGYPAAQATEAAASAAADAVAALPGAVLSGAAASASADVVPPSCTYVSAVVTPGRITVGWVGDSRAYWIGPSPDDARQLTVDDSPAAQLAATGVPVPGVDPHSVALLRWLGADAVDTRPRVVTLEPTGPGRLLLCSDGLSRYVKDPAQLTVATAPDLPDAVALLTDRALESGGRDNIAVTLLPYPPPA